MDWQLLVFFAALFIVVEGLNGTGLPDEIYHRLRGLFGTGPAAQTWNLTWFSVAGSNVFPMCRSCWWPASESGTSRSRR